MALMYNTIRCCRKCDKKEWPDKITMTAALNNYNLTKLDLFTPNVLYPENPFPVLRFGIYDCMGVYTTMFMKDEVEERAGLIHGKDSVEDQKARRRRRTRIECSMRMAVVGGRWVQIQSYDAQFRDKTDELHTLIQQERAGLPKSGIEHG